MPRAPPPAQIAASASAPHTRSQARRCEACARTTRSTSQLRLSGKGGALRAPGAAWAMVAIASLETSVLDLPKQPGVVFRPGHVARLLFLDGPHLCNLLI